MEVNKGSLLIAEPFLLDPNFKRSVILLCEHEGHGTTGFILNKPLDIKIHELIGDFPETSAPVFIGGPVGVDRIFYLHDKGDVLDESVEVAPGIYWGGNFEKLKFLMETGVIQANNIRFFVGYSGWSEGQLLEELNESSWLVEDMDPNYLFRIKPFVLWQTVLHNKGNIFTVIAQMPDNVSLN